MPTIGGIQLNRFLKRYPEYLVRRERAIDIERKKCLDLEVARDQFTKYKDAITRYSILLDNIQNFDETGFNISIGSDRWIITREPKRRITSSVNSNREYATAIEAISATGVAIALVVILSAKLLLRRWFEIITSEEAIAVTKTGYLNNALALQWIQRFYKATINLTRGTHRLLIYD